MSSGSVGDHFIGGGLLVSPLERVVGAWGGAIWAKGGAERKCAHGINGS